MGNVDRRIGIAGAGGIGSNVARHLVQCGITQFKIVDFDRVAQSNLDRQFYFFDQIGHLKVLCLKENLQRLSPSTEVDAVVQRIMPGACTALFSDCDLVVEGFDDAAAKKHLVEELSVQGLPIVSASGIAGKDMQGIKRRKIGNCTIVGDFSTDVADAELFPPKVAVITAMMAAAAMDTFDHH
ncbi:MAG: thiamine biosynthesis protein ThiF [Desulfobacterales bacterium]|nr:MAG: thiamine biosynthesis protein ThiF [Desulfobacterales bacterium]